VRLQGKDWIEGRAAPVVKSRRTKESRVDLCGGVLENWEVARKSTKAIVWVVEANLALAADWLRSAVRSRHACEAATPIYSRARPECP
jgi:hypothetical protein